MNPPGPPQPGQQPTPEQIAEMQRQLAAEAQKRGITVQEYVEQLKAQAMQQAQMQAQAQQQHQHQQQVPINASGPPNPAAVAVANFLKSQELKPRTCILDEKRKDMFRGTLKLLKECTFYRRILILTPTISETRHSRPPIRSLYQSPLKKRPPP